jgi:multiple antibiotic resistance protein
LRILFSSALDSDTLVLYLEVLVTIVAFALLCLVTYAFFVYGERLVRYLGPAGLSVIARIMGLILAVIGVQMLIGGISGAVDAYRGLASG